MNKLTLAAILAASAAVVSPASATIVTFDLGRSPTQNNISSLSTSLSNGLTATVTAKFFSGPVASLDNVSDLRNTANVDGTGANALLFVNTDGVGIPGGGSPTQIDTNQANRREAVLIEAGSALRLQSFRLAQVDSDDTIRIFGVNADGSLESLGFSGAIVGGGTGFTWTPTSGGRGTIAFNPELAPFNRFVVTSFIDGTNAVGQGFQIRSITAAVPEPATWAMMIGGFGVVGAASRRRRTQVSVAA